MLVNATFVPDTALLVPGASGATAVLTDVRAAAADAVREMVADRPARVVVVAPGPADRTRPGPFVPTLSAAGIPDDVLGWAVPGAPPGGTATVVDGTAAAAALLLLGHAGWTGPTTLVEVATPDGEPSTSAAGRAAGLTALGREVTGGPDRVALLVAGSLSARHGPDAPLAEDERAVAVDRAMLADLEDAGPDARARLAGVAGGLAAELAVTAWAPWRVALGGVPTRAAVHARTRLAAAPFGVTYVVATWRPA